jgi:predicted methyltransferase
MKTAVVVASIALAGFALASGAAPLAREAAQGADPAINRPFHDPDFDYWLGVFERDGREVYDRRGEIVEAVELRQGMIVADIGAGTGLFTRLFASAVGETGRVFAVDVSRSFVENIRRRAEADGLQNVEGVVSTQTDVSLPPGIVDLAFLCDTYHHFEQPTVTLRSIHAALRPGGQLVIVDFRRVAGESPDWVMGHVRAGKDAVIREVEAAGFRFIEERGFLRQNYFLRFERITPVAHGGLAE